MDFYTSGATQIEISTFPGETYNYDVDWDNDGVFDEFWFTGNALQWRADAPHGGAVLNLVQPGGQALRYEFAPGESAEIVAVRTVCSSRP